MNRLKAYRLGVADALDQNGHLSSGITWDEEEVPKGAIWNEAYDRGANMGEALWPVITTIRATTHTVRNLLP